METVQTSQEPQNARGNMPETAETTEIGTEDLFADLIIQTVKNIQHEKELRAALQEHKDKLDKEARQQREKTIRLMLLAANECLKETQKLSATFNAWLKTEWKMGPEFSQNIAAETNRPTAVLPLFGEVISQGSVYGQVCLVKRRDESICVDILVKRVTRDYLEWDASVLEQLPDSFDRKLDNLANPEQLIEATLRALLDCRK